MPKTVMQDVVPPEKRSIRNVPLPKHRSEEPSGLPPKTPSQPTPEKDTPQMEPIPRRSRRGFPMWGVWAVTVAALLVVIFAVSTLFTSATIVITPKQATHQISLPIAIGPEGDISFETVSVSESANMTVDTTGTESVTETAEGELTLYNEYTTSEFPLVVNTRFEAPNGNIYRSTQAVRIPGMSGDEGNRTPGTAVVSVRASEAGDSYNLTEGRLTIPGLEGEPSFKGVYAEVTSVISGGFEGERGVIDPGTRDRAEASLRSQLEEEIGRSVQSQIPDRFILYPETIVTVVEPVRQVSADNNKAVLESTITARGAMFLREELEAFLIEALLSPDETSSAVRVHNLDELSFTPGNSYDPRNSTITGTISGTAHFVWVVDEAAVKKSIGGRNKDRLDNALSRFEAIEGASATVRPFWLMSFPSDPDDMSIITNLGVGEEVSEESQEGAPESDESPLSATSS
ncbi:MAG: hypothetical protein WDZ79_03120 [Candidatus Paceibacterota bacterium]